MSCTKDTRTEILDTVYHWYEGEALETCEAVPTEGNRQGRLFWLDGIAGTGKSTIAQTVADHFNGVHVLGASFFCSRNDADCSKVGMIFPTIVYQLLLFNASFKKHLSDAIDDDPDVQFALVSRQLEKLIIDPLHAAVREEAFPSCIIVIDALDECKDDNATSIVLTALSIFADRAHPIKFFITSRPVANVLRGFHHTGLMKYTNALILHSIPWDISQKDIRVYLEDRLSGIARFFELNGWPDGSELDKLVEQSRELFIFAATAANFIDDKNASNPKRQLKILLSTKYIASSATSPHRHLDELYLAVLRQTFPDINSDQRANLGMVLGTVALLFDPLCAESLDSLLEVEAGMVRSTFRHLHSIAMVPAAG